MISTAKISKIRWEYLCHTINYIFKYSINPLNNDYYVKICEFCFHRMWDIFLSFIKCLKMKYKMAQMLKYNCDKNVLYYV